MSSYNGYNNHNTRRKPAVCRSTFMRAEEIDRERAVSGWNQYAGEEEMMDQENRRETAPVREDWREERMDRDALCAGMTGRQNMEVRPYFTGADYNQILEEQKILERDLRMLQSMYPEAAKMILPHIEEACDKMEYEGSPMYDQYPDQTTVWRVQDEIYRNVQDQFPPVENQEDVDEIFSMQYSGKRRNPPGKNWLEDMIRVLLLQEMHHRRCRHRNCRRRY